MTHPTQGFSTPHARELFAMGAEWLMEVHPDGQMHNFTGRPVTLPSAHTKAIQDELARLSNLQRHEYRGKPGEL